LPTADASTFSPVDPVSTSRFTGRDPMRTVACSRGSPSLPPAPPAGRYVSGTFGPPPSAAGADGPEPLQPAVRRSSSPTTTAEVRRHRGGHDIGHTDASGRGQRLALLPPDSAPPGHGASRPGPFRGAAPRTEQP